MGNKTIITCFVVIILWILNFRLSAQANKEIVPEELISGNRIRVSAPQFNANLLTGIFTKTSNDTLFLIPSDESSQLTIPFSYIQSLEKSKGKTHGKSTLKGAGIGLLIGAALGGIAGLMADDPNNEEISTSTWILYGAGAVGIAGTVIGGTIGLLSAGEKWQKIPLSTNSKMMK